MQAWWFKGNRHAHHGYCKVGNQGPRKAFDDWRHRRLQAPIFATRWAQTRPRCEPPAKRQMDGTGVHPNQ